MNNNIFSLALMRFKHNVILIITKIFIKNNITVYYENKFGIKNINKTVLPVDSYLLRQLNNVDPNTILIGFDGLNDTYTLNGTLLKDSPHYELMQVLNHNKDLKKTDYFYRSAQGTLDERTSVYYNGKKRKFIRRKFLEQKSLKLESIPPILAYELEGGLYVIDGKHRVANACLFNQKINCLIVSKRYLIDGFWYDLYIKMLSNPHLYKKNILQMEKVYESRF